MALAKTLSTARKDRKSTRLNSIHLVISYAVFCLKKKNALFLDWAFGEWRFSDRLRLRMGLLKHPLGIFGEVPNVGNPAPLLHLAARHLLACRDDRIRRGGSEHQRTAVLARRMGDS